MAKVAFITGATRGIGKQIAIEFAKDGYDIAFNYRKENEDLENIKVDEIYWDEVKYELTKFSKVRKSDKFTPIYTGYSDDGVDFQQI